jgi:hypothetical protein
MLASSLRSDRENNLRVPLGQLPLDQTNRRASIVPSKGGKAGRSAEPVKPASLPPKVRLALLRSQREQLEIKLGELEALKTVSEPNLSQKSLNLISKCVETKRRLMEKRADLGDTLVILKTAHRRKAETLQRLRARLQTLTSTLNDSLLEHVDYDAQNNSFKLFSNPLIFKNLQKFSKSLR